MNSNGKNHHNNHHQNNHNRNQQNQQHVLVWEQPGLDEIDRAQAAPEHRKPTGWFGKRHMVTVMLFLGMANAYVMRTNMSVAVVAMVNNTGIKERYPHPDTKSYECPQYDKTSNGNTTKINGLEDGEFVWSTTEQGFMLTSFFYGYVITQIPFGFLAKRYGSKYFLGIGMLINSLFGLLVPVSAQKGGLYWLVVVRFVQGLGEGPIVPCTHALLAKWIPPNERSRMGAFVYAGAQFGSIVSMPLSGLLAAYGFAGGWPSIFYVFGIVGALWCVAFMIMVSEDPESDSDIKDDEKKYIISSLWGAAGASSPPVPWKYILTSMPFYAILLAHIGQNFGYEILMTQLPTFMKQILRFDIKSNGLISSLPYLAMWIFSIFISWVADWMITRLRISCSTTRKCINSIGQYGPAVALIAVSYSGCNRTLAVTLFTIGLGLNGGIYSGFKVNHLDISPRFAGILMSFTNCTANIAGMIAPIIASAIINNNHTQANWRIVFFMCAVVYIVCSTFYVIFASGERQAWDDPKRDEAIRQKKERKLQEQKKLQNIKIINETHH